MRMKNRIKKGIAALLSGTLMVGMAAGIIPGNALRAQAEGEDSGKPGVAYYATKEQLMDGTFAPDADGTLKVTYTFSKTVSDTPTEPEHRHCFCGKETKEDNGDIHNHSVNTTWEGISSLNEIRQEGCYYLKNNITLTSCTDPQKLDLKI